MTEPCNNYVLALDPSSVHIGWAVFEVGADAPIYVASGTEKVPDAPQDVRVPLAGDLVKSLIQRFDTISMAVVEMPDFIASTAKPHIIYYFRAVGAVEYVLHAMEIPFVPISSSKNKHRDMKQRGRERFYDTIGRYPTTNDESDAFVMGHDYIAEQIAIRAAAEESESPLSLDDPST